MLKPIGIQFDNNKKLAASKAYSIPPQCAVVAILLSSKILKNYQILFFQH